MSTGVNRSKSKKYATFLRYVIEGQVKSTSHFYQMQESPSQRHVDEVVVGLSVAVGRVLFTRTATPSTIPFLTPTPNHTHKTTSILTSAHPHPIVAALLSEVR
jgi:hypothetical protein